MTEGYSCLYLNSVIRRPQSLNKFGVLIRPAAGRPAARGWMIPIQYNDLKSSRSKRMSSSTDEIEAEEDNYEVDEEQIDGNDEGNDEEEGNGTKEGEEEIVLSPLEKATQMYEAKLEEQLKQAEESLRKERQKLSQAKERESESGKNGFFMIQSQVNEFLKRKDADQKMKVKRNKREFVFKMLPVVDAFRLAKEQAPSVTEKGKNMHKSYESLLDAILLVFDKYGFKEFTVEKGDSLSNSKHSIVEVQESPDAPENPEIIEMRRIGMFDSDGDVLRKAEVVVLQRPHVVEKVDEESEDKSNEATAKEE